MTLEIGLISIPVIIAAMLKFLKYLDDAFGNGSIAKKIPKFLQDLKTQRKVSSFLVNSIFLTDIIYGKKIISCRSFISSSIISSLWILILLSYSYLLSHPNKQWIFGNPVTPIIYNFLWFFFIGIVIDYISSCITRWLFNRYINSHIIKQILVVIFNTALSITIFVLSYTTIKELLFTRNFSFNTFYNNLVSWISNPMEVSILFQFITDAYLIDKGDGSFDIINGNTEVFFAFPEGIIFLSSLLTSLWSWVFLVALLTNKATRYLDKSKDFLLQQSSIDSKPIFTLGIIITILLAPIWIVLYIASLIYTTL